jgi:hypothetical protein
MNEKHMHEWEQQPKETERAFEAFKLYLDMGPSRTHARVGKLLGKNVVVLERWASHYGWADRIRAKAVYLAKLEREATAGVVKVKAAEWLARQQGLREREWSVQERCIDAAEEALRRFLSDPERKSSLAEIARILDTASKLGRLASGMPTDRTEVAAEVNVTLDVEWEMALKKVYGEQAEKKATKVIDV